MPPNDNREWVERLIFYSATGRRYTQDSPVLPDVWIAFAQAPDAAQPLLLTPDMDPAAAGGPTTPGTLRHALAERLKAARRSPAAWCRAGTAKPPAADLAHNQSTVLATLWFDELVRVVIPMSRWWGQQVEAAGLQQWVGKLTPDQEAAIARLFLNPDLSAEAAGFPAGKKKPAPGVLWTLRVVGTIALLHNDPQALRACSGPDAPDEDHYRRVIQAADDLLAGTDELRVGPPARVWSVSLNRTSDPTVERSRRTVKADAATVLFEISCKTLAWAVVDSGIDARHPAFRAHTSGGCPYPDPFPKGANGTRVVATYDFNYVRELISGAADAGEAFPQWLTEDLAAKPELRKQLKALRKGYDEGRDIDWAALEPFLRVPHDGRYDPPVNDHGTHVAGILAADWPHPPNPAAADGPLPPAGGLRGVCTDIALYDLRVLTHDGTGQEFNIISALQFVRFLNDRQSFKAIHGVNLSLSLRHDVANYACGHTPICQECERLVAAGTVVVAAAGNRGFQRFLTDKGPLDGYYGVSLTDPGNADGVITVGSTHRFEPHSYGVSYFSSRGPTGDGRLKPDLVAPGEKIEAPVPNGEYGSKDGTSMAAPHVSGAAALLMARNRELIGHPARVKQVLCRTATDLGRERAFQGHGMVDALRALQLV